MALRTRASANKKRVLFIFFLHNERFDSVTAVTELGGKDVKASQNPLAFLFLH